MKYCLLILVLVFLSVGGVFSQSENSQTNTVVIRKDSLQSRYLFNHEVEYYEAFENRLISELNSDGVVVRSLDLDNFICEVVFKNDVSTKLCHEKLGVLVRHLNFSDYRIE